VSAQGDLVEQLPNGDVVVRDGVNVYRGRPIAPLSATVAAASARGLRPVQALREES
jgi:hypothetical protein